MGLLIAWEAYLTRHFRTGLLLGRPKRDLILPDNRSRQEVDVFVGSTWTLSKGLLLPKGLPGPMDLRRENI